MWKFKLAKKTATSKAKVIKGIVGTLGGIVLLGVVAGYVQTQLHLSSNSNNQDVSFNTYLKDNKIRNIEYQNKNPITLLKSEDTIVEIETFDMSEIEYYLPFYNSKNEKILTSLNYNEKLSSMTTAQWNYNENTQDYYFSSKNPNQKLKNIPTFVKNLKYNQECITKSNGIELILTLTPTNDNWKVISDFFETHPEYNNSSKNMILNNVPIEIRLLFALKQNKNLIIKNNKLWYMNDYSKNRQLEISVKELKDWIGDDSKIDFVGLEDNFKFKINTDLNKEEFVKYLKTISQNSDFKIWNSQNNFTEFVQKFKEDILKLKDKENIEDNINLSLGLNLDKNNNFKDEPKLEEYFHWYEKLLDENKKYGIDKDKNLNSILGNKKTRDFLSFYQRDNSLFYTLPQIINSAVGINNQKYFNLDMMNMGNFKEKFPNEPFSKVDVYVEKGDLEPLHVNNFNRPVFTYLKENLMMGTPYENFIAVLYKISLLLTNRKDIFKGGREDVYDLGKWEEHNKEQDCQNDYLKRIMLYLYQYYSHPLIQKVLTRKYSSDLGIEINGDETTYISSIQKEIDNYKKFSKNYKKDDETQFLNLTINKFKPYIVSMLLVKGQTDKTINTIKTNIKNYVLNAYQKSILDTLKNNNENIKSIGEYQKEFVEYLRNEMDKFKDKTIFTYKDVMRFTFNWFNTKTNEDKGFTPTFVYTQMIERQDELKRLLNDLEANDLFDKTIKDIKQEIKKINIYKNKEQLQWNDENVFFKYDEENHILISGIEYEPTNNMSFDELFNYKEIKSMSVFKQNMNYEENDVDFSRAEKDMENKDTLGSFLYTENKQAIEKIFTLLLLPKRNNNGLELIDKENLTFYEYLYNLIWKYHNETNDNVLIGTDVLNYLSKFIFKPMNKYFTLNPIGLFDKSLPKLPDVREYTSNVLVKDKNYYNVIFNGLDLKQSLIEDTIDKTLENHYKREDFYYYYLPYNVYYSLNEDNTPALGVQEFNTLLDQQELETVKNQNFENNEPSKGYNGYVKMIKLNEDELRWLLYKSINLIGESDLTIYTGYNEKVGLLKQEDVLNNLIDRIKRMKFEESEDITDNQVKQNAQFDKYLEWLNNENVNTNRVKEFKFNSLMKKSLYVNDGMRLSNNQIDYGDEVPNSRDLQTILNLNAWTYQLYDEITTRVSNNTIDFDASVINKWLEDKKGQMKETITVNITDSKANNIVNYASNFIPLKDNPFTFIPDNVWRDGGAGFNSGWMRKTEKAFGYFWNDWKDYQLWNYQQFRYSPHFFGAYDAGLRIGTSSHTIHTGDTNKIYQNMRDTSVVWDNNNTRVGYDNNNKLLDLSYPLLYNFNEKDLGKTQNIKEKDAIVNFPMVKFDLENTNSLGTKAQI